MSQRLAEQARKRERFEEMRQQLELDQEVRGSEEHKCFYKTMCLECIKKCLLIYRGALSALSVVHFTHSRHSETVQSYEYRSKVKAEM